MSDTVLIIGSVWPEPNSTAAGTRMLQLIHFFSSHNYIIVFACAATESPHAIDLKKIGVTPIKISLNNSSFDQTLNTVKPSIALFDRFMTEEQFGWRISKHSPNTIKILNTEDLHSLRKVREQKHKKGEKFQHIDLLEEDITKREIASIYRCDLSLIISDTEMNLLSSQFNINTELLHYLPFLLPNLSEKSKDTWPSYEERDHFVTIGNFRHEPNWNSILYLKTEIWPLIRKELPKTELHIYGAYPPPKAMQLHNKKEGFLIKGWAKDADEVMKQSRICLAPLQFGAGLKGKLVLSMCCGTPSITTHIGAEGINNNDLDWNGFITDTPEQFAKASTRLFTNKSLWHQSQQNGIAIINSRFNKETLSKTLHNRLTYLKSNLKEHRVQNFIGAMLNHHTIRSTEYMSRWIEAKNK